MIFGIVFHFVNDGTMFNEDGKQYGYDIKSSGFKTAYNILDYTEGFACSGRIVKYDFFIKEICFFNNTVFPENKYSKRTENY